MQKRIISSVIAFILLFSLAACGNSGLEMGFTLQVGSGIRITCAVKSETRNLQASDTALDFYYGYLEDVPQMAQEYHDE